METRWAGARRARADHAASALRPALAAIVLIARQSHASLRSAASAEGLGAGALARPALTGLGRQAWLAAPAAIGVIRSRVHARERRTAHDSGRPDRRTGDTDAVR